MLARSKAFEHVAQINFLGKGFRIRFLRGGGEVDAEDEDVDEEVAEDNVGGPSGGGCHWSNPASDGGRS